MEAFKNEKLSFEERAADLCSQGSQGSGIQSGVVFGQHL